MRFIRRNKGPAEKGPERPPPVDRPHARTALFDSLAPLYDLFIWILFVGSEQRFRKKVLGEITPLAGARVLELFCGTASLSIMAARGGAKVTGLDLSPGMLSVARQKSQKEGLRIGLVRADSVSIPFAENDETTQRDRELVLKEASRVLKQGGRAVIFDYHRAEGIVGFLQKLLLFFIEEETAVDWIRTDIQGLLRKTGFRDFRRTYLFSRMLQVIRVER
jgi:demethylmenaquinone methyltransferase/2-methoxy-6-polyprenyl-1,4-benzoquinol methylase